MSNWSLNKKLYFVMALLMMSNAIAVYIGISKLGDQNKTTEKIHALFYKRIAFLNAVNADQLAMAVRIRDVILSENPEEAEKKWNDLIVAKEKVEKNFASFIAMSDADDEVIAAEYKSKFDEWSSTAERAKSLVSAGKQKDALQLSKHTLSPLRKEMGEMFAKTVALNEKRMDDAAAQATVEYGKARNQLIMISLSLIFASLLMSMKIINAFNKAIDRVISNLNENSLQVAAASSQLASASQELSQASTEQASSLQETSASLEEITAMIAKAADSAQVTSTSSDRSKTKAESGRSSVEEMMASMDDISASNQAIMSEINENDRRMQETVRLIRDIGEKTKVINDIVFQTKLLSFNASVEAARAGENGKGFAVVAEEVGNLARMSGSAAKEISEMLEASVIKVEQLTHETKTRIGSLLNEGKYKIESGVVKARECSTILLDLVESISKVSELALDISTATKEQSQGINEINRAMVQLDTTTQQNSAVSAQSASAAEQLSTQATSLTATVADLIVTVQGSHARQKSSSAEATDSGPSSDVILQIRNGSDVLSASGQTPAEQVELGSKSNKRKRAV